MGIRNLCKGGFHTTPSVSHYPSWGSGTSSCEQRAREDFNPLSISLPLMGIRNIQREQRNVPTASSLPLMGIRNFLLVPLGDGHLLLTTPHGDQERLSGRRRRRCSRTHYPSWGSGTAIGFSATAMTLNSLPLMGIRNHRAVHLHTSGQSAHYPSWGSGTCAREDFTPPPQYLTTPHGDQELPSGASW